MTAQAPVPLHIPVQTEVVDENRKMKVPWIQLLTNLIAPLNQGKTVTVVTAKLTGGGVEGSQTFRNGVLIAQVQAT